MNNIWVGALFWADDIILIAENERQMTQMLDLAAKFATDWNLSYNHVKSTCGWKED